MTVPNALFEAATIDGASEGRQYVSIMLPLIKPAITSVGIFTFLGSWSDFLELLIYINNERNYTLTLGLYAFVGTFRRLAPADGGFRGVRHSGYHHFLLRAEAIHRGNYADGHQGLIKSRGQMYFGCACLPAKSAS